MTDTELTILSLVAEGSRFGHEIQQLVDDRGLREWLPIGFASIYYILNKLERQGLLTSQLRTDGRTPAHKVYEITEAGRGVLQTAISDLLRQPRALGAGFELGLANLSVLKPHQVYTVLTHHLDDLNQRFDLIEKSWERHQRESTPEAADHIRALYTHSIALMKAEKEWLHAFIEDWKKRYPAADKHETKESPAASDTPDTLFHRRTTPDAIKMIQRLKRPTTPPTEE